MDIIITVILIFALSIIVLSFVNLKLSIALYISYLILVPYLQFKIAGFPLSYNLVNTILLAVFLYQSIIKKRYILNYQLLNPFLFLFLSLLLLSLFTWGMPWNIQLNSWRATFMQSCILSFIVWNLTLSDQKSIIYFKLSLIISISIAGIYGIYLMQLEGFNPYTSLVSNYFGIMDIAEDYSTSEARLDFSTASRIQSTMFHPMTWTLILCFLIIIFSTIYLKTKNKKIWILIGLVGFNIIISGVRTGIAALTIGFIYFLIRYRKIKLIISTLIVLIAITLIIQSNDSLSNLFTSFTDVGGQKSEVRGSTISMRLGQLQGAITEIKGHELAGKGYGWSGYYMSQNGAHPKLLAFESLLFMILCNSGYIGMLIWLSFFLLLYRLHRKILIKKIDIFLMDTFIITYAAYATGTGDYGYLSFFAIFYSFLFAYLIKIQRSEIHSITKIKLKNIKIL